MRRNGVSDNTCAITGVPSVASDVEHQPVAVDAELQRIGTAVMAGRPKLVVLNQVVDRDCALVLDFFVGAADRRLVERHRGEAAGVLLARVLAAASAG